MSTTLPSMCGIRRPISRPGDLRGFSSEVHDDVVVAEGFVGFEHREFGIVAWC